MAGPGPTDGTIPYSSPEIPSQANNAALNALFLLLDAASAVDEGAWVQFYPFSRASVEVQTTGGPTFSFQLYGSNSLAKPANSANGSTLGAAITAAGMTALSEPPRWIKANLTAITGGGTVSVLVNAFAP